MASPGAAKETNNGPRGGQTGQRLNRAIETQRQSHPTERSRARKRARGQALLVVAEAMRQLAAGLHD